MKKKHLVLLLAASIALYSCGKDNKDMPDPKPEPRETHRGDLLGTYEFVGITVTSDHVVTNMNADGTFKTITHTGYYSKGNSGTVVIDSHRVYANYLEYVVDTVLTKEYYHNNVLLRTADTLVSFAVSKNDADPYTLGGWDLDYIYFEKGVLLEPKYEGLMMNGYATKATLYWRGDTLFLNASFGAGVAQNDYLNEVHDGKAIIKLRKKDAR